MHKNISFEFRDRDWLYLKYVEERLSTLQIARLCNCHYRTIHQWLIRFGIPRRPFSSKGAYFSKETRVKLSLGFKGSKNPNWKGGRLNLHQLIRGCDRNRRLIALILKRDKYTCQLCGQVGGELEVDHIKPFADILDEFLQKYVVLDFATFQFPLFLVALKYKPFWDKTNLRTLCKKCNRNYKNRINPLEV